MKKTVRGLAMVIAAIMTMTSVVFARDNSTQSMLKELVVPNPYVAINALNLDGLTVGQTYTTSGGTISSGGTYFECKDVSQNDYKWSMFQGANQGDNGGWTVKETDAGERYLYDAPGYSSSDSSLATTKHSCFGVNTTNTSGADNRFVGGFSYSKMVAQFDFMYENSDLVKTVKGSTAAGLTFYDNVGYMARFYRVSDVANAGLDHFFTLYCATDSKGLNDGKYTVISNIYGGGAWLSEAVGTELPFEFGKWYTARVICDMKNKEIRIYYFNSEGTQINSDNDNYFVFDYCDSNRWGNNNCTSGALAASMFVEFRSNNWFPTAFKNVYTVKEQWEVRSKQAVSYNDGKVTASAVIMNDVSNAFAGHTYFDNYVAGTQSPVLVLAVYEKNTGRLIDAETKTEDITVRVDQYGTRNPYDGGSNTKTSGKTVTTSIENLPAGEYVARAYLWRTLKTLVPYTDGTTNCEFTVSE